MPTILKLNKISPVIESVFDKSYILTDACDNPDGIIVRSFNMADYEIKDGLLAVGRAGAGVNNIPLDKMTERGVVVFNTPGANANAVKELVLLGMLMASRDVLGGNAWVNTLETDVAKTAEKGKSAFAGHEIFGKTLGVIGLGAIGTLVANSCVALGLNVMGYDPVLSENTKKKLSDKVVLTDLDEIFRKSDIITIHVPLLDGTKNLINASAVEKLKGGVILLNMSRGGLVDVEAVKKGLADGKIAKYVVDFPDESVIRTKDVIVFPHLGASTEEAEDNCAEMAAAQIKDYIENGNVTSSVNFPNVRKERTGKVRTCVLADKRAAERLSSFPDSVCATRGDLVYCIIDSDAPAEIPADGVIKKRSL